MDWTTGEPREDPTGGVMRRDAVVEEVQPPSGEPAVTVSGTTGHQGSSSRWTSYR